MSQKSPEQRVISRFSQVDFGPDVIDLVEIGSSSIKIARPSDMDRLIDSREVSAEFAAHQYMPYWASIWPVSITLAQKILNHSFTSKGTCLELGCGLGLAGIAALQMGFQVTLSDYDQNALDFARKNCELNGFLGAEFLQFNWRAPVNQTYDFIVGADLAWDHTLVPCLVDVFKMMLNPKGVIWLVDQNRIDKIEFSQMLEVAGFEFQVEGFAIDPKLGWEIAGSFFEIRRKA